MRFGALSVFVLAVGAAAAATLAAMFADGLPRPPDTLLILVAFAAAAGARPVRIPGLGIEMTPTHPFILVGLAALGPLAAALIALAGIVGAAIGRARKSAGIRLVFNLAAVVLSTGAASQAFFGLDGHLGQLDVETVRALAGAAVTFFLVNTGLVTAAIVLEKRQGFVATWRRTFLWSVWSYAAGLGAALAMLPLLDGAIAWVLAVAVPPCWLLVVFYRTHAAKQRPQESG